MTDQSDKAKNEQVGNAAGEQKTLARRELFSAGLLGLAGALLQSCSNVTFLGSAKTNSRTAGGDAAPTDPNNPAGAVATDVKKDSPLDTSCSAVTTTKIDPAAVAPAPEDVVPIVRFYGSMMSSALIAVKLKDPEVAQFSISTEDGRMIAFHVLGPADYAPSGGFRPIVIDCLYLSGLTSIKIISSSESRTYASSHAIDFMKTYKSKPVQDLSSQSVPTNFTANQTIPQFADLSGFNKSAALFYPNSSPTSPMRPLFTAQKDAKWSALNTIKGDVLDIMGEPIANLDLIEHQTFCTYVMGPGDTYFRTVVKVG